MPKKEFSELSNEELEELSQTVFGQSYKTLSSKDCEALADYYEGTRR